MTLPAGRHFLQIPGPTNVPDRVLRAIDRPTIDHRGPEFAALGKEVLAGHEARVQDPPPGRHLSRLGHRRLGGRAGQHALARRQGADVRDRPLRDAVAASMADALGLEVEFIPGDWRHGADPAAIEARLRGRQRRTRIKAVCVVHNETSTGVVDAHAAGAQGASTTRSHPALLMVDTISSLASIDYRHDEWGVDVTVGGSQKGLMLPPGLSLQRASATRRSRRAKTAKLPRSYWDWDEMLGANKTGFFPYTPATNLLYGLREALAMLRGGRPGERLRAPRPPRRGDAPRGARLGARDPVRRTRANTAARSPPSDARRPRRRHAAQGRSSSASTCRSAPAWASSQGKVFRIGHLGDFNDLMLAGTLAGVEMGLELAGRAAPQGRRAGRAWTTSPARRRARAKRRAPPACYKVATHHDQ